MALLIPFGVVCGGVRGDLLEDPSLQAATTRAAAAPAVKTIANFEDRNPFAGGVVVTAQAPEGHKALRIDSSYVSMDQTQNWLGYDLLKTDLDSAAAGPMNLLIEIRDADTRDYWTRVNYETVGCPLGEAP